jgi:hypothetical protein
MLLEWLDPWLTRVPLHLREMGYLRELHGIRRRWRQWRRAWAPHCRQTADVILAAMSRCPRRRKAVILGSGFLHDVPLQQLAAAFDRVVLVDLVHPLAARWQARRFGNVELLAADVSGTALAVWQAVEVPGTPLPRSLPELFLDDDEVDLVASVNLLSQLPCLPEQYLRRLGAATEDQINDYCRDVVRAHLDYLRRLPGVVALVADVEAVTLTQGGREVARKCILYDVPLPFEGQQWRWPLVPRKARPPHHGVHLVVVGIEDVKEDRAARAAAPSA